MLIDCVGGTGVDDKGRILKFVDELVDAIKMEKFGSCWCERFGVGDKVGYSMFQMITTSNISGHFCDSTGEIFLDVFSCKEYDEKVVIYLVEKYFKPAVLKYDVVNRG